MTTKAKVITWISVVAVVLLAAFVYVKFYFPYGKGVNEGSIIYFQEEGFVFKTYEGKMILAGFKTPKGAPGTIQSNELKFSVVDKKVARQLEQTPGSEVRFHWKRYLGTLPWRGNSQFIVDSVYTQPAK